MLNELADYLAFYLVDRERPQVLDLGTGTGSPAALVLRRIRNSSVIGIDTDPAMIVEARQRLAERTLFSVSCGSPIELPTRRWSRDWNLRYS